MRASNLASLTAHFAKAGPIQTKKRSTAFALLAIVFALLAIQPLFPSRSFAAAKTYAVAKPQVELKDFVQLSNGTKMWVEAEIYDPKRATKLIANGLTNSATYSFSFLSREFVKQGANVIRFDFAGQAKTLYANLPLGSREYTYQAQVRDLVELTQILKSSLSLTGPIDILGQSYGGGIILAMLALEPKFSEQTFRTVTVYAPYTELLKGQDEQIKAEIKMYRTWYPWITASDEELYNAIFRRTVKTTYWMAEPEIIGVTPWHTNMNLEGVIANATGIRPFRAIDLIPQMPDIPINVIVAAADQYIPGDVIPAFWDALPQSKRGVYISVYEVEHKMLQVAPRMSAKLADLTSRAQYAPGSMLEAHVMTGNIYYDGKVVEMIKPDTKSADN